MSIPVCYNPNPPVLLQQGFDPAEMLVATNRVVNQSFRIRTDRGYLKHLDFFPFFNDIISVQDNLPITINLGGQNIIENSQIGMWSILSQFGKNHTWQLRAKFSEGQTGFIQVNGNDRNGPAVTDQTVQLIAKYSTPSHEQFLKDFRLKYGQRLKQRQYSLVVPATALTDVTTRLTEELPRNNGQIIGIGISLNSDITDPVGINELPFAFITIKIDGVAIIENVSAIYYSWQSGRDYYLQPICINPGATVEIECTQTSINSVRFNINANFYFGN